ncbi:ABC transporter ATP-binding protein [Paralimibaculum aggregatum]|uniref:ABC transporter ATP-binding protein n=1 Tax=Paralimibaculum aggregatum TaxID=3036245 RepID=A0ABQ6LTA8_9RHOB|nr:ABC transporter ATP-binding protein [Limibaculum sp. NKW23]GMG85308.1 ABC transporter ATP-binding protein [Limibaculum sp. NKW23]
MARITLETLRHAYMRNPRAREDFALHSVDIEWEDGGAYALLGPSGCGKTTLLNIISGLLRPSEGRVLFDGEDVTRRRPDQRNIAQVFQFPVIYDTMTVRENLAFPLRNRGVAEADIAARVAEIGTMLELDDMMDSRAAGLTADSKQKISLGRGLVRQDVAAILFDEPLTVIDPHLKWKLRSKLRELHQRLRVTMIYVTHDQTEALTFADQVVVMSAGEIVQLGTPEALFERPHHTFVGHFIGSPGMNLLPARVAGGRVTIETGAGDPGHQAGAATEVVGDTAIAVANPAAGDGPAEIGVRPEFVRLAGEGEPGLQAALVKVSDTGRHRIAETRVGRHTVRLLVAEGQGVPEAPRLVLDPARTFLYRDGWLAGEAR